MQNEEGPLPGGYNPSSTGSSPAEDSPLGSEGGGRFGRAREFYSGAKSKVGDAYGGMKERVGEVDVPELLDRVRTYVRSNPGKALLISVGAGFVMGMLLRRRDDDD